MSATENSKQTDKSSKNANRNFGKGLARAFGGAIIFTLPMMMTMEMWWLGFYISNLRLALLLALNIPLLIALSYYVGFEDTFQLKQDALDGFVAYAVGFIAAIPILYIFSVIEWGMSAQEIIGKVSLQAIPGSLGAILAQSQLGGQKKDKNTEKRNISYGGKLFIMAVGSLFLAFNLAPTGEMVVIAYKMSEWHMIILALGSMVIMHAFVYAVEFHGQASIPEGVSFWSVFLRYTVVGYAIALSISLYALWTFGRTDGESFNQILNVVFVLGFPAAVGAASARLII